MLHPLLFFAILCALFTKTQNTQKIQKDNFKICRKCVIKGKNVEKITFCSIIETRNRTKQGM